jgi:general secretion pathway protein E
MLDYVAESKLQDRKATGKILNIENLTMVLGNQCGKDYHRIDPLKIDVAKITNVMSYAFDQCHHIVPSQASVAVGCLGCRETGYKGHERVSGQ